MFKYMVVIPARSGSRGVLHKNTRYVGSKTLLDWSIEHAIESMVNKIVVSTNDPVAKVICEKYEDERLQCIDRPEEISTATSASEDALIHAVEQQEEEPEFVIMLQPSSPFRFNRLVNRCINHLEGENTDSLLTGLKLHDFFWHERYDRLIDKWGWFSSYKPDERKLRQQCVRTDYAYFDNGNISITRTKLLLETRCRVAGRTIIYPISHLESMQIDTEEELADCDRIARSFAG